MVVKTYRGLLADGGQDRIKLQTSAGKVGYKIIKFEIIPERIGLEILECLVSVWKTEVATPLAANATVDFTDANLLAVAFVTQSENAAYGMPTPVIIFDNEVFNQDIYVTNTDNENNFACNYYLELEVIPLASDQAAITTVKAMRGSAVD